MNNEQIATIEAYNKSAIEYQNTIAQLKNYNHTYDFLIDKLTDNQSVLDLACGPGNICSYLLKNRKLNITGYDLSEEMLNIAKKLNPNAKFIKSSIIDFKIEYKVDLVINGFGLPYLNKEQAFKCLDESYKALKNYGLLYLSFMNGDKSGFEVPSFNKNQKLYIYYHKKESIVEKLLEIGFNIIKEWKIDYIESGGNTTEDIIIIGEKSHGG